MTPILKTPYIEQFRCLGADCPDTCCTGFTVQVDSKTWEKYKSDAPELLDFITEKQGVGKILAFDKVTGDCPKMECGSCTIHAKYGTDFLTDTCHLYPRITRKAGDALLMSGDIACPEVARIGLFETPVAGMIESETDRLPHNLMQYRVDGMDEKAQLALHERIISLAEQSNSAEQALLKLMYFTRRFAATAYSGWNDALDASWRVMDVLLPKPEIEPRDPFFLLIHFATLLAATKVRPSKRLSEVLKMMEHALNCRIDAEQASVNMESDSITRADILSTKWRETYAPELQHTLKKLLMLQLSSSFFPYAGLGKNPEERVLWLSTKYATIRLGLMSLCYHTGGNPPEAGVIQVVQTITRVMDHLQSLDLAMPMIREAGWNRPERLGGLLVG